MLGDLVQNSFYLNVQLSLKISLCCTLCLNMYSKSSRNTFSNKLITKLEKKSFLQDLWHSLIFKLLKIFFIMEKFLQTEFPLQMERLQNSKFDEIFVNVAMIYHQKVLQKGESLCFL